MIWSSDRTLCSAIIGIRAEVVLSEVINVYSIDVILSTTGIIRNFGVSSMWYMIVGEDYPDSLENRVAAREAHLARITELDADGRVLAAGPLPAVDAEDPCSAGFTGSLLVIEFASLEDAKAWADQDPYVAGGVYKNVTVKPFKRVLP
jgi:uncharacterized protein YciI